MHIILYWILSSVVIGLIGVLRQKYFFETLLISLLASPLMGIRYVMIDNSDQGDELINSPRRFMGEL